ncbi:hypothetical protein RGUI_3093 [Rhodovulum sp. P5]|uniref:hypothetical protein n=1 Tax=Rhodovulum sp. P5 TaxID=1564506 RepID=UPI0009C20FF3|nr:hypothetical protein [Rhodovulum sp. P5]ARE41234.1 hypothetical protein RGUI_3093 [Rhodovulum sp. P5]
MNPTLTENKPGPDAPADVPRMMGEADLDLIRAMAARLPPQSALVEIGPWLGGVSLILADYGQLHVVDRFLWSESNAAAWPGLAEIGASFRPLFEATVAHLDPPVQVHETDCRDFVWPGGRIGLCLIDAPRSASGLLQCLAGVAAGLDPESVILFKNGLNPGYPELPALLEVLLGRGVLAPVETKQAPWCNILAARPGPEWESLAELDMQDQMIREEPVSNTVRDPWGGRLLAAARVAERAASGDWAGAYARVAELPLDPALARDWDICSAALPRAEETEILLAVLAELVAAQTDSAARNRSPFPIDRGPVSALRGFWLNAADHPWRTADFDAELIVRAAEGGAMVLPAELGQQLSGRTIVEIGTGLGLSGVGFLAAGASAYLGAELGQITRDMVSADFRLTALAYLPAAEIAPERLGHADLVVLRGQDRQDEAVGPLLDALPEETEILLATDGPRGMQIESLPRRP